MFNFACVTNAVRSMEMEHIPDGFSRCQQLELKAKYLGFQSWNHLRDTLRNEPDKERFEKISTNLMFRICAARMPARNVVSNQFTVLPDGGIAHYSYWVGYDELGEEIRIPRPLYAREWAQKSRKFYPAVLVIETEREFMTWLLTWHTTALIPEKLTKMYMPSCFDRERIKPRRPKG